MQKLVRGAFFLYSLCLLFTMAGMEFFSSLLLLMFFIFLAVDGVSGRGSELVQILKKPPVYLGLVLFVVSAISAVLSPVTRDSVLYMIGINRNIVLFIGFVYLIKRFDVFLDRRMLVTFLFFCIVVSVYSFFQFYTGLDLMRANNPYVEKVGLYYRAVGFFNLPLTFAYSFGMIFFLMLPFAFSSLLSRCSSAFRWFFVMTLGLMPLAIVATSVRGAWLAFAFTLPVCLILVGRRSAFWVSLTAVVAPVSLFVCSPSFRNRLMSIVDLNNSSNAIRLNIWRANLEIFLDHPIFGIGPNQNSFVLLDYYKKLGITFQGRIYNYHAHNDILQTMAGSGTLAVVCYIAMSVWFLAISYKAFCKYSSEYSLLKSLALGSFCGQIFFHIGGMTQCNYIDREVNHVLMVLWTLSFVLHYFDDYLRQRFVDSALKTP